MRNDTSQGQLADGEPSPLRGPFSKYHLPEVIMIQNPNHHQRHAILLIIRLIKRSCHYRSLKSSSEQLLIVKVMLEWTGLGRQKADQVQGNAGRGEDEGRAAKDVPDVSDETRQEMKAELLDQMREQGIAPPEGPTRKKKLKNTFLNMGEEDPFETDDFEAESDTFQDMTTLAHGELEHHREMRHYARLAAWEMPLLSSMLRRFWTRMCC